MATNAPEAKKGLWTEFKEFLNQGDFITIAVGLVIALYFQQIVNSILNGVIFPIIAAIFGKPDFQDIGFDIGKARISIGLVLNAVISFVVVALILFLLVKAWNSFKARTSGAEAAKETELSVLRDIREELRTRD